MKIEIYEAMHFEENQQFSLGEFLALSGMSDTEIRQLIDCAAIVPTQAESMEMRFNVKCLVTARIASRLQKDFELDTNGLTLALTLLERVQELEGELRAQKSRVPKHYLSV